MSKETNNALSSVGRALTILECFNRDAIRLSLAEIAKETEFYKSTILRLLKDLQTFDYIQRDMEGKYLLGSAPLRLGDIYRLAFASGMIIQTCLQKIAERTGESTAFYIKEGDFRICLYRRHSQHMLRTHIELGDKVALSSGGSACRVIRAYTFLDSQEQDLLEARELGYCFSDGERTPGVASISLPIFLTDGKFAGAMVVSGASSRFDKEAREEALRIAQDEILKQGLRFALSQPIY